MEMSRKLVRIIRQIFSGRNFLIHPVGPDGPAYAVKPGLTAIAQKKRGVDHAYGRILPSCIPLGSLGSLYLASSIQQDPAVCGETLYHIQGYPGLIAKEPGIRNHIEPGGISSSSGLL